MAHQPYRLSALWVRFALLCLLPPFFCLTWQSRAFAVEKPADAPVCNDSLTEPVSAENRQSSLLPLFALAEDAVTAPLPAAEKRHDRLFSMESPDRLFGYRRGNIHPLLTLQGIWTDNLYNINIDERSSFLTVVSPGIWIGFPWLEDIPVSYTAANAAIGGSRFMVTDADDFERLQAYLFGGLDYRYYSADADISYLAWKVEGFFRYNMPAGFSLQLLDRYSRERDSFDRGSFQAGDFITDQGTISVTTPSSIRDYSSNLADFSLSYDMTDTYSLNGKYSRFLLVYDDEENSWLNRTDNGFSLAFSYHYSPKTSFFAEYSMVFITYDRDTGNDSAHTFYYGGVDWQGTAKTSLSAKAGYQIKQYDSDQIDGSSAFSMEGLLSYKITEKTGISFSLYKALEETDSFTARGIDTIAGRLAYEQRFSYRLHGKCAFSYELNDYQEFPRYEYGGVSQRKDTIFAVKPSIEYILRDWITVDLAYSFENRDSNDNPYDYTSQSVILTLNFSI